jgi:tetratricopeptide (TPR) repeat protein
LKHRAALGIAGLFVALLVLAAGVSTWQAVRAIRAEGQALAERDRAEKEKDRAEAGFRMARDTVDRFFTQVAESPKLKAQGMEKFRRDLLQNAKEFYERFIGEQLDAPEVRHDLGLAHLRLARIHRALGDYVAARPLAEKAIEILGELSRTDADAAEYARDLAAAYVALGYVNQDNGLLDKAEAAYLQALGIQERLATDHADVVEYCRALATTQSTLGELHRLARQYDKAHANLEQSLAMWRQLVQSSAHDPEDRDGLAKAQLRSGISYTNSGRSEKADALLKEAVGTYEALARDYPDVPGYRQSLATTYSSLGSLYCNHLRQAEKAEAAHQKALQIVESLAREHPDVLLYEHDLGRCYLDLAMTADLAGRSEAVLPRLDKAIDILEKVVGKGHRSAGDELFSARLLRTGVLAGRGDHLRATDEASTLARLEDLHPVNLYNIACVFARSSAAADKDTRLSPADRDRLQTQYADRAMQFLHQAVAKGYQNAPELKSDPDLAPLRLREDFQKLVQEVEQKGKK